MPMDSLQKQVIDQLVAAEEGRALHNAVEPYFRAFTGAFSADMPFTVYFEAANRPVMFVYDPTPVAARSSHYLFMERCEQIKAHILPITAFVQELADTGYVTVRPLGIRDRPPLPPDCVNYWRKYKHFYTDVIEGLSFMCCSQLRPAQKLYDEWLRFNPRVFALKHYA
ncbi:hypothetical protein FACS1894141_4120 [Spirochaetia bacterium]|nr:hypothetical protein FACS1894141_4120 [Spirochaetia bacterium]